MNTNNTLIHTVRKEQLLFMDNEWSCEASTIGLPVGIWPERLIVTPPIGNGNAFVLYGKVEFACYYMQMYSNTKITVFND